MIRDYGSQNVRADGGRIKIRPCNMIRDYGSRWMRLKKVSTIFDHYLKHAVYELFRLNLCTLSESVTFRKIFHLFSFPPPITVAKNAPVYIISKCI